MTFYPNERIGVFIDGPNFYSSAKNLGIDIDYKRLLENFRTRGRLVRAVYYTTIIEDQDRFSAIRPLVDWLDYNGYTMVTKPAKTYTDAGGNRRVRGDMDVEFTVDVLEAANNLDHIILFTGDGDFKSLVAAVQRKGVRVSVVSSLKSSPPMISDDLRRQADVFIELTELAKLVGRDGGRDGGRPKPNDTTATTNNDDDYDDDDYEDDELE